jgi:hypothetical protein
MKKILLPFLFYGLFVLIGYTQDALSASLFNHASSLPAGNWAGAIHPGLDVALITNTKVREKTVRSLHWHASYYYHRLVHQGVLLYGEYNWQKNIIGNLGFGLAGGGGYQHTFENHEIFSLDKSGKYDRSAKLGKAHAHISLAAKIQYRMVKNSFEPFLQYRFRLITPFVKTYVPLLPAESIHLGTTFPINSKRRLE